MGAVNAQSPYFHLNSGKMKTHIITVELEITSHKSWREVRQLLPAYIKKGLDQQVNPIAAPKNVKVSFPEDRDTGTFRAII